MNKYDYTLQALDIIHGLQFRKSDLYSSHLQNDGQLIFLSTFNQGKFHFIINTAKITSHISEVIIKVFPIKSTSVDSATIKLKAKEIPEFLNTWETLLNKYYNHPAFVDPNILKFQQEFYSEFELLEDESIDEPLKINQVLALSAFLDDLKNNIENYVGTKDELNIKVIINEIHELNESLGNESKRKIAKHLAKIFAMVRKEGLSLMKALWSEAKKKSISELINWGLKMAKL